MVLQNKYKARASRRYNAARGGSSSERGRGRGGPGKSRGGSRMDEASFPELSGEKEEEDGEGDDDGEEQEEPEEEGGEQDIQSSERGKYARRKLQSNAWRYEEKEVDPHAEEEEEEEEEPEVDLTALREKVSKLDSSRTTNALSSRKELEDILAKHDEDDADVDRSLSHLLHRQRIRDGKGESSKMMTSKFRLRLDDAELAELEKEGRRLQEEKEKAQGPRAHMERFKEDRGKAIGASTSAKTISLNIGSGRGKERNTDQEEANRRATTRRRTAEVSTLYDDDGHDGDQNILDELLQASLSKTRIRPPQKQPQGLGNSISPTQDALAKERARTKGQPAVRILQGGATSASRTEGSVAQSQSNDNQDFLDSVL